MHNNDPLMHCRVCGLLQEIAPWGPDGTVASFAFCPCCGVQFGYEDMTRETVQKYRAAWIEKGAQWFDPVLKPPHWNLEEQMKQVPPSFK